jgi:hypothetical protein
MPMEALVRPLPRELTTPPVTKMCLATLGPHAVARLGGYKWIV